MLNRNLHLIHGECLAEMSKIPDNSVDMVLCDLPFGTTDSSWDTIIPLPQLWSHYQRIVTRRGAVVLFGQEPFSSCLRMSNIDQFRYDWIWKKTKVTGHLMCRLAQLRVYETVSVFSRATLDTRNVHGSAMYNP